MNYYNYYTEIEETFVRRRGRNLLLSPIDWAMIEDWQQRGIPLNIVLRAIETVFDGYDKKLATRTIKGLLYCREEIESQYEEWLKMQVGKSEDASSKAYESFSVEGISDHITRAIDHLRKSTNDALREDFERACARLEELRENLTDDFETVDKTLSDIENFLDSALLTNCDKEHLKKLEKETADQLKAYKRGMEKDVYKKTFDLMLLKSIREQEGIPRLSLFYL